MMCSGSEGYIVKLRGLSWSATAKEIETFFEDVTPKNGLEGIHVIISPEGRPSGEAYIELHSEEDYRKALNKHKERLGYRHISVVESSKTDMELAIKSSNVNEENSLMDGCVRLRGLAFGCSKETISKFFEGLDIVPNGIVFPKNHVGRSTGQAFVQFVSKEIAEMAMKKHHEKIGDRYVEVLQSSLREMKLTCRMMKLKQRGIYPKWPSFKRSNFGNRRFLDMQSGPEFYHPGHYNRSVNMDGYESCDDYDFSVDDFFLDKSDTLGDETASAHKVRMRGLPFEATTADVSDFFNSVNVTLVRTCILKDRNGRPTGEADVYFSSHEDAVKAMAKNNENMNNRYIELFLGPTQTFNKGDAVGTSDIVNDHSNIFSGVNNMFGGSNYLKF